jgi:catechol 2,3-dioxygenase-like lactoylglutathione lyase family enzyme
MDPQITNGLAETMPTSSNDPQHGHTTATRQHHPKLIRIRIATTAAPDVDEFIDWYARGFGHQVRERGTVAPPLANAWGAPASAGRRYALLSLPSAPDVYLRVVESTPVPGFQPLLTFGWNAFEIILDDIQAVRARLADSPFKIIGEPRPLGFRPTIHAMQVVGPAQEVLYLATETGDRSTSPLPAPNGLVGRPFIMVLGGPDVAAMREFYTRAFDLEPHPIRASRGQTLQGAWGGTEDGTHPITLLRLREHGNSMELDGYVKPGLCPRPRIPGEMPPGNAMASFSVPSLDDLNLPFLGPPTTHEGLAYAGARAATLIGPAGELIELIEEPARGA